jgi:type IV secretory pathway VirB2 component (pilin)
MTAFREIVIRILHKLPKSKLAFLGLAACLLVFPDFALASGGITEFSSPLEQVVNTITGPAGKWISIVAMALCGVIFIMNKNENRYFLPSEQVYLFLYNQIIIRSKSPVFACLHPAKSPPRAGRLAGMFLLSLHSNIA